MIASLLGLLFTLVILGVIWWGVQTLLALIPIAEPFKTIIYVISVVILVIIVLYIIMMLLGMAGIHVNTMHLGGASLPAWA